MKKRLFFSLFVLLSVFSARAYDFEVDGIYYAKVNPWSDDATEVEVTSGDDEYSGSVVIPATVTHGGVVYRVTAIGRAAFYDCSSLTTVTIPEGVSSIEPLAFWDCSGLTSITIPEGVTDIGYYAFQGCSGLTSITIPEGVTYIGQQAFWDCSGLTSITIPEGVIDIGQQVFWNCSGLTSVTLPESVTVIGHSAFGWCSSLTSITIPESVTSIREGAFFCCSSLTSIIIPEGVTSIENRVFSGCSSLASVTLPESVAIIGVEAFKGCSSLTSITIPGSVASIEAGVFNGCSGLTSITIPESITSIEYSAFSGCSSLTSVTLPESVTIIGVEAFKGCSSLTSVTLPESVDSVGIGAFRSTSIGSPLHNSRVFAYMPTDYSGEYEIPSGIQTISDGAFADCSGLTSVMIPEGTTTIGNEAFKNCSGLTSITIPASVISIGRDAFHGCSSLTSITIPESVTSVGYDAFIWTAISYPLYNSKVFVYMPSEYSGEYEIPSGIQTIAGGAFRDCKGLTSITLPEGVTSIGRWAFYYCSSLTSITIPESVTFIDYAFEGCKFKSLEWNAIECSISAKDKWGYIVHAPFGNELTSVSFGNNVKYIPDYLCENCRNLTTITIPESVTSIGDNAFVGTAISSPVYNSNVFAYMPRDYKGTYVIPSGIQMISGGAFAGCNGLTSVTIPESMTAIGDIAFQDCSSLTSVKIPDGVVKIGYWGFNGCSGLKSLVLPATLDTIGYNAFGGCCNCETVTCFAKKPPFCSDSDYGFYFCIQKNLYVPRDSKEAYKYAPIWRNFDNIEAMVWVMVQANDTNMGTVAGGGIYTFGSLATLRAVPNKGCHFVKWDDGNTDNPRKLTVEDDIALTAVFAKNGSNPNDPSDPNNPGGTTANEESLAAAPFAYVQGRTAYLSDGLGEVEVFTATGQRVYRGTDRSVTLPQPGVYILRVVADGRRCKVVVK